MYFSRGYRKMSSCLKDTHSSTSSHYSHEEPTGHVGSWEDHEENWDFRVQDEALGFRA